MTMNTTSLDTQRKNINVQHKPSNLQTVTATASTTTKPRKPKRIRTVEGSCNHCLKKRVKCSLEKPHCKRCLKDKLVCNYDKLNLKWGKILNIKTAAPASNKTVQSDDTFYIQHEKQPQQNKNPTVKLSCIPSIQSRKDITTSNDSNSLKFMISGANRKPLISLLNSINDLHKQIEDIPEMMNNDNLIAGQKHIVIREPESGCNSITNTNNRTSSSIKFEYESNYQSQYNKRLYKKGKNNKDTELNILSDPKKDEEDMQLIILNEKSNINSLKHIRRNNHALFSNIKLNLLYQSPSPSPTPDQQLLYFTQVLSPKLHAMGIPLHSTNLASFINKDPLLSNIVLTLSSFHMFNEQNALLDHSEILTERFNSIRLFTDYLKEQQLKNNFGENLFNACVLLGTLDGIINDENSTISCRHLFGARAILHQLTKNNQNFLLEIQNPLTTRMLSMFNTMDVNYCLLSGEKCFLPSDCWYLFSDKDCWFGNLSVGDPFFLVLNKLTDITNLGSMFSSANNNCNTVETLDQDLTDKLQLLESEFLRLGQLKSSPWLKFVSAFANIGLIYYYRVFLKLETSDLVVQRVVNNFISDLVLKNTNLGKEQMLISTLMTPSSASSSGYYSNHSIEDLDGFNQLGPDEDETILEHCLLFPLLVIGAHCISLRDREIINKNVNKSLSYLKFANINTMSEFLNKEWRRFDENFELNKRFETKQLPSGYTWWQQFGEIAKISFIF